MEHVEWPFALLALVCESASFVCLWELDRIACGRAPGSRSPRRSSAGMSLAGPLELVGRATQWLLNHTIRRRKPVSGLPQKLIADRDFIRTTVGERWRAATLAAMLPLPLGGIAYVLFRLKYDGLRSSRSESASSPIPSDADGAKVTPSNVPTGR